MVHLTRSSIFLLALALVLAACDATSPAPPSGTIAPSQGGEVPTLGKQATCTRAQLDAITASGPDLVNEGASHTWSIVLPPACSDATVNWYVQYGQTYAVPVGSGESATYAYGPADGSPTPNQFDIYADIRHPDYQFEFWRPSVEVDVITFYQSQPRKDGRPLGSDWRGSTQTPVLAASADRFCQELAGSYFSGAEAYQGTYQTGGVYTYWTGSYWAVTGDNGIVTASSVTCER
ncbi:MAG: hypothetical protein AAGI52_02840 [Bacteroidota bacterium]